jgi:hypothetical protein
MYIRPAHFDLPFADRLTQSEQAKQQAKQFNAFHWVLAVSKLPLNNT